MNPTQSGLLYLGAAAGLAYLWVTGNLARLVAALTGAVSGQYVNPHPISVPGRGTGGGIARRVI